MAIKKKLLALTFLGLIPFYIDIFFKFGYIDKFASYFYGAFIISFLSGMHWKSLISAKKTKYLIIPMIPIIFCWFTLFFFEIFYFKKMVILGLIWCLIIDLTILRKSNELWFLKIRVIVTVLAVFPLITNFFYQ